ncbi:hypothetical protein D3C80_1406560 [compost metagenome]
MVEVHGIDCHFGTCDDSYKPVECFEHCSVPSCGYTTVELIEYIKIPGCIFYGHGEVVFKFANLF